MILQEANITPEPVGWQRVDEGVEEGEDYVWVVGRLWVGLTTIIFVSGIMSGCVRFFFKSTHMHRGWFVLQLLQR